MTITKDERTMAEAIGKLIAYGAKCYMNAEGTSFEMKIWDVFRDNAALGKIIIEEAKTQYRKNAGLI